MSAVGYASRGGYRNFGDGHQQQQRSFGQAPQQYARAFAEMPRQSHRGRSIPVDRPIGYNSDNRGGNSSSYNRPFGQKQTAPPESNLNLNPDWDAEDDVPDEPKQPDVGHGQQQQSASNYQGGGGDMAPQSNFQTSGGGGMNRDANYPTRDSTFQNSAARGSNIQSGAPPQSDFQGGGGYGIDRESNFQAGGHATNYQSGGAYESNVQTGGAATHEPNYPNRDTNYQSGGGGMTYQPNFSDSGAIAPPSTPQRPPVDRSAFGPLAQKQGFSGSANKTQQQQHPSPKVPFFSDNVLKKSANSTQQPFQQGSPIVRAAEISPLQQQQHASSEPVVNAKEVTTQAPMNPQNIPFYGEALAKKQAEAVVGGARNQMDARNDANSNLNPDWRSAERTYGANTQFHGSGPKPASSFTAQPAPGYCGGPLTVQRDSSSNVAFSSEGVANTNTATMTSGGDGECVVVKMKDLKQLLEYADIIKSNFLKMVQLMEAI